MPGYGQVDDRCLARSRIRVGLHLHGAAQGLSGAVGLYNQAWRHDSLGHDVNLPLARLLARRF